VFCAGLVIAGVFALIVLRLTCVQAFKMPAGSMEPTILVGDHFLVNKAAYGIHIGSKVFATRMPARGDIAAFLYPMDRSKVYIKRVIGLPGETIEVRGKTVYVNGRALDEPYARHLDDSDDDTRSNWGPQTVPDGQVFVLGDNRDNSLDGRFFGWVPVTDLVGKAKVVYFSWEDAPREHSREPTTGRVRWERIALRLR
jgi:signal peptidase I